MNRERMIEAVAHFAGTRAVVIGEPMLDVTHEGTVTRISPEAPIPILDARSATIRPGGAMNVAENMAALGADVVFLGVLGTKQPGPAAAHLDVADADMFSAVNFVEDPTREAILKSRFISTGYQMLRLDSGTTGDINADVAETVIARLDDLIERHDPALLVVSDYAKGMFDPDVRRHITGRSTPALVIGSKRPTRWLDRPPGCLLVCNEQEYSAAAAELGSALGSMVVTRGAAGMSYMRGGLEDAHEPVRHTRHLADVQGAGDTALAALALMWIWSPRDHRVVPEMLAIANAAAAVAVSRPGTALCDGADLVAEIAAEIEPETPADA